eukprot:210669-Karenia_brevis.AAC.1
MGGREPPDFPSHLQFQKGPLHRKLRFSLLFRPGPHIVRSQHVEHDILCNLSLMSPADGLP